MSMNLFWIAFGLGSIVLAYMTWREVQTTRGFAYTAFLQSTEATSLLKKNGIK